MNVKQNQDTPSPASAVMAELGQVGDYEIRLLRVFKTVVECGGFSAAEAVLNVSRSTISVHMSNLEQRLKLTLCTRGRSGFALTEDGVIIYDAVRRLFSQMEDFRSTVNALHVQVSGELNLVASDTISLDSRSCFPDVLGAFCQRAPDVYINFETAPMNEIERRILNDEADVGFIPYHRSWTVWCTSHCTKKPATCTAVTAIPCSTSTPPTGSAPGWGNTNWCTRAFRPTRRLPSSCRG